MVALFESAMAQPPGSGHAWQRLTDDTADAAGTPRNACGSRADQLPGDPALVAAAMGGMLSMLAYALLPIGDSSQQDGYSDDEVIDTLTDLLLNGLSGGR